MITSWKEMSIGTFQRMYDINGLHIDNTEKTFRITALLAGIDYDDFISMPLSDSRKLIEETNFLMAEPKRVRTRSTYRIGKRNYRLMKNMDEMSVAQYINYQAIATRPIQQTLPELMSLVLIPEGEKYGDSDMEEIVDEIREHLNIEDALSVAGFFTKSLERLIRRTLRRLDMMMAAARIMAKKEEKEAMTALQTEMSLITEALRSEFGFHW